jgi:hypothetical protein
MVTLRRTPLWAAVIYALGALALGYAIVAAVVAAALIVEGDTVGIYASPSWGLVLWVSVVVLAIGTYVVRRRRGSE